MSMSLRKVDIVGTAGESGNGSGLCAGAKGGWWQFDFGFVVDFAPDQTAQRKAQI
jgi:hypothetical protein